jgi:hypothetical protein
MLLMTCSRAPAPAGPGGELPETLDEPEPARAGGAKSDLHPRDPCDPLPRVGEACDGARDSYCVVDWGEPGGWSTALWCRKGKWEIENEVNLD